MHQFILSPGIWLGEGKISFSASPEFIKFYTKWEITLETPFTSRATQVIQMQGIEEETWNYYTFLHIDKQKFEVELENEALGLTRGKGLYDERVIAWELGTENLVIGFENYERQANGDYFHHAEYGGNDQFGTTIEGLLWQKTT